MVCVHRHGKWGQDPHQLDRKFLLYSQMVTLYLSLPRPILSVVLLLYLNLFSSETLDNKQTHKLKWSFNLIFSTISAYITIYVYSIQNYLAWISKNWDLRILDPEEHFLIRPNWGTFWAISCIFHIFMQLNWHVGWKSS